MCSMAWRMLLEPATGRDLQVCCRLPPPLSLHKLQNMCLQPGTVRVASQRLAPTTFSHGKADMHSVTVVRKLVKASTLGVIAGGVSFAETSKWDLYSSKSAAAVCATISGNLPVALEQCLQANASRVTA